MVGSVVGLNYAPMIKLSQWTNGCTSGYFDSCKSSSAVLRFSMALSALFFVQLVGTTFFTKFYDYMWFFKFLLFSGLVVLFYFLDAGVFNLGGYAWYARIAAFFYLILQQIILIDFTYAWNEKWVKWSEDDSEHGYGKAWLVFLVIISFILIGGSCSVLGILYWQFRQCGDSTAIITLTVLLSFIATVVQLFISEVGSILTSSIIIAYATYICYSAVTLNPEPYCNPTLSTGYQTVSQVS
jgi:serine incorporator 1/3